MAEMNAATENMVMPENCNKPPTIEEPASSEPHAIRAEALTNDESLLADLQATKESAPQSLQSQNEDERGATDDVERVHKEIPVKPEPEDKEMQDVKIKEEFKEDATVLVEHANQNQQIEEKTLVGKVKIKPMASLVETIKPNPQPGLHPFFAGFDDHIRSMIINRQPQFAINSSLMQGPVRFMYYDNSTNMNLKKILNGHKMAQTPVSRHSTYRPYVPINVPRPPRSQVPFRTSFSTQTPPMFIGNQPDVSASPSTSYQVLPGSRPPVSNSTPQNNLPVQNYTSPKNFAVPNFTPARNPPAPKFTPVNNFPTPNLNAFNELCGPSFPPPPSLIGRNVAPPQCNKVSTSSSTDDLENHSSENNVIIKTEIDLGIDSKEDLQATLNDCNNLGTHFMGVPATDMQTSDNVTPKLEIPDTEQHPVLTGDSVTPPVKEVQKRSAEYKLPTYSTTGWLLCKCCDFRCNRKKKMKEHFETVHTEENNYKCFYCIKKSSWLLPHKTVHDLEHHVAKVHRGEKRWQCKHCSKSYKCRASYRAHLEKTCFQSRPYACHMCTFTCVTEAALEKHIKAHEKLQETQICPFCNKTFKKFYLKQHLITVHAPPEEKPFHCISCSFASGNQSVLDNHYKRTGHDKQVKCDQCDYACRSESIMKNHVQLVHEKEHPNRLICGVDGCQVKCKHVRSLRVHRQIHTMSESELFTCPDKECSKKFTTGQSLRHHTIKTKHHKPFQCPDCVLRFLKEESLNKHIQSIHVPNILKKMEKGLPQGPVCVKNVVDVYNYVEGLGVSRSIVSPQPKMYREEDSEDSVTNFGCWLGISGFGDTMKTDCDNQTLEANISEGKSEHEVCQVKEINEEQEKEEDEDEEYQNLVPITCLVEVKQDETEEMSSSSVGKTDDGETLVVVKKEEDEEAMDDSDYQHINPDVSCLVECQQNATMDSSTATACSENEQQETECLPANLVKIEVGERDVS